MQMYQPTLDKTRWTGRRDAQEHDYVFQHVNLLDLNRTVQPQTPGFALLGFACDEGIKRNQGRVGAAEGPRAFREVLAKMPVHHPVVLYDAGDVVCLNQDLEAAQAELARRVHQLLTLGLQPMVIGGGHETAWGHFQGLETYYPEDDIAILNFDAHFDLRPLVDGQFGSSGTPFRQIHDLLQSKQKPFHYYCAGIQPCSNTERLFKYAEAHQVHYLLAESIHQHPYDLNWIRQILSKHRHVYVSVCLDVFQAALAPGVSAPQVLGLDSTYVLEALKLLAQSNQVISMDIVELSPPYDVNQQTAKLAAVLFMSRMGSLRDRL